MTFIKVYLHELFSAGEFLIVYVFVTSGLDLTKLTPPQGWLNLARPTERQKNLNKQTFLGGKKVRGTGP